VAENLHELTEIGQVVGQRRAGQDLPQVELVASRQVEILDEIGASPHQHIVVDAASGSRSPRRAGDAVEEPRFGALIVGPREVVRPDRHSQPVGAERSGRVERGAAVAGGSGRAGWASASGWAGWAGRAGRA
jgi:hypothetical protein